MSTSANALNAKALSTMAARCALAGAALTVELSIDRRPRYVVVSGGRVLLFDEVRQVEALLGAIGRAL